MKLSLGPVPYYWSRQELLAFYAQVVSWPVDVVYLGETVCSKRRPLAREEWLSLAAQLAAAGKEVVLSTLALVEAGSEVGTLRRQAADAPWPLEANDMTAVHLAAEHGTRFVTGPTVNCYNPGTLRLMAGLGAYRVHLPVELSRDMLAELQGDCPEALETEVMVWGRMPLSLSARCFTARSADRLKDDCGFLCLDHPDGLLMRTQEGEALFNVNGVQIQSALSLNLIGELPTLERLGVDLVRVMPQARATETVVAALAHALAGTAGASVPADAAARAAGHAPSGVCNGYWYGDAGMARSD